MNRSRVVWVIGCVLLASAPRAALAVPGTVRLTNGGWIQGDLVEVLPGDHVTVRLDDGTTRQVAWAEVDHVEEAPQPAAEAAVPAPPPAAVVAAPAAPAPAPVVMAEPVERVPDGAPASASETATDAAMRPSVAFVGLLGIGGVINGDLRVTIDGETQTDTAEADLDLTYGFGAQFDLPVHPNFSIGVIGRAMWWQGESGTRRALFVDGAVAPRLRYPFGSELHGVWFIQVPVGVGLAHAEGPTADQLATLDAYQHHVSAVFVVGVDTGVHLLVSEHSGFVLTLGWMHHAFSEEVIVGIDGGEIAQRIDARLDQVSLQAGFVVAL